MMDNNDVATHISKKFNQELEAVRNKVLAMGGVVESQIELAIKALVTGDMQLAELVIKQDNQIDNFQRDIDIQCTEIIALRQPTAFDLRLVLVVLSLIDELERIGDLAERVAKMAIHLSNGSVGKSDPHYELKHMAGLVQAMLKNALNAFARMSSDGVLDIIRSDEEVDLEYGSIIRQLITQMMEDPRNITRMLDVLWTVRALERIGDHARYICEHLIYLMNGEDIRHLTPAEAQDRLPS